MATNFNGNTGTIFKITPGGKISTFATGFPANSSLEGVVTDIDGNVFVSASDNTTFPFASTIFRITAGGAVSTFGSIPGQCFGLAFDSVGDLFAADSPDQTIYKFTPTGVRGVFAGPASFTAVQGPVGLAFDRWGNLFVSTVGNDGNDAILEFTPAGAVSTFANGLTGIPRGLAFGASGNLFVAEIGNGSPGDIVSFTPAGTRTVFAAGLGRPTGNGGAEFLTIK